MERDGADTYKVRAFRNAARALEPMSEAELAELAARGRLQSIPGVGKSTALAITEALAGEVPAYLATLETEPPSIALDAPARRFSASCGETATRTRTGRTGGAPSGRWPRRPESSVTATWS